MKVFGRKILDPHRDQHEVDFDDLVFVTDDGFEIVVSVYKAKTHGTVEVRGNDGCLIILPRASNVAEFETRR